MPSKILISNKVGGLGEIVGVVSIEHVFSKNETFESWVENGGTFDSWVAKFAVITVTDKEVEDLNFLSSGLFVDGEPAEYGAYYFAVPEESTAEFEELYFTGGITATWEVISNYLVER